MATTVLAQPQDAPERARDYYQRIAAPLHTVLLVCLQGGLSYWSKIRLEHTHAAGVVNRIHIYERTIFTEWFVLALVLAGVRLYGSPLSAVLGERWRSVRQVAGDLGFGVAALMISLLAMAIFGTLSGPPDSTTRMLLPQGGIEIAWWIALSLTAGICEEAIYRGYLQRQFTAFTRNVPAGIILAAAAFGAAHAYQGIGRVVQIATLGAVLGILAYWRKTVRPGMIGHALQDLLALVAGH
jgi:membrane protease YdiL (CAAX protease family)